MGDRVTVEVKPEYQGEGSVFLYSHYDGSDMPQMLAKALDRGRGRWGDSAYLARIIFSEMIQDSVLDETGYGISAVMQDGYRIVVDDGAKTVTNERDGATVSYEEFIAMQLSGAARQR